MRVAAIYIWNKKGITQEVLAYFFTWQKKGWFEACVTTFKINFAKQKFWNKKQYRFIYLKLAGYHHIHLTKSKIQTTAAFDQKFVLRLGFEVWISRSEFYVHRNPNRVSSKILLFLPSRGWLGLS